MADISYLDAVELIRQSYGKGTLTWTETSQALSDAGITSDNYLSFFENSGVFDVVKNADGTARNITWRTAESISDPLNQISSEINSNVSSSVVSESAYVEVPGDLTIESGASSGTFSAGAKIGSKIATGTRFVFGEVAPAVGAAMTGCALGKTIDGSIYNIGEALNLNPPWALNPETWGSITSDIDENDPLYVQWAGKAFNFLLGIDPDNGTTTAYIDENALAAFGMWLNEDGVFQSTNDYQVVSSDVEYAWPVYAEKVTFEPNTGQYPGIPANAGAYVSNQCLVGLWGTYGVAFTSNNPPSIMYVCITPISGNNYTVCVVADSGDTDRCYFGTGPGTFYNYLRYYLSKINYNNKSFVGNYRNTITTTPLKEVSARQSSTILLLYVMLFGGKESIGGKDGVGDQTGAVLPDTSTWTDFNSTKQYLDNYLPTVDPDFNDKKVTQTVPQEDGSQKTYTYIPVPFVNIDDKTSTNPSTGEFGQVNPGINPNTDPVTNPIVQNIPKITVNPIQSNPDVPSNPPDTGSGNAPTVVVPDPQVTTGMWAVYTPSNATLRDFGSWLWSSDFVDQIKKLFSNPMDAIIGLHQVYSPVSIGGVQNIKCGYIDSGISSYTVSKRYSTIDCGTKYLKEYFGNIFDYDPYTQVHLYLPFIGIVPLKTSEVMRGRLTVIYHVDVLTGSCLAEVRVKRDDAGGTLYTFSGSCAISLPFTSGSYMNGIVDAAMVGINSIGAIASGFSGNLLAMTMFAGGAIANTFKEHTNVQKSGSFSGNPGAMGIKTPYLIITRPQAELASNYQHFVGIPSNENVILGSVSGYARVKSTHVESINNASEEEKREIESLLKSGVLIQ